jgi:hypothetical protein
MAEPPCPFYAHAVITKFLPLIALLAAVFTPALATAASADQGFAVAQRDELGRLDIKYKGQPLLQYAYASNQFKPYVRELYTLKGDNVLLDAPADHLHHHGLMYAIRVNGVNFWEERDQPGYQRSVSLGKPVVNRSSSGLPQISFRHVIHWVPSQHAQAAQTKPVALLVENRTLTITIDEGAQEVALSWRSDFEVGEAASKVTLAGANYHGLGLRLPQPFNRDAQHQNSEGAPYPTSGKGDVLPARWSAVSHAMNGHEVTVALFGRQDPNRGLPLFFSMVEPFTYLSVTQGLDKEPLEYSAGEKFSLEYLLLAYPERRSPDWLQKRYQQWKP